MIWSGIAKICPEGLLIIDQSARIVWLNDTARRLFKWPGNSLIGQHVNVLVPSGLRRRHHLLMRTQHGSSRAPIITSRWRCVHVKRRDGSQLPVGVWLASAGDTDGPRTVVFIRDMSELTDGKAKLVDARKALAEQGEQNALLALVAEHISDCVVITNAQGRAIWVNEAMERLTGYSAAEFAGRKPGELLQGPETDPDLVARIAAAVDAGESIRCPLLNYTKQGKSYWTDLNICPVRDAEGRIDKFIAVQRDVTRECQQKRALEAARRAAQRAESRLASAIEAISEGFVIYDEYDRLVMANSAYKEMRAEDADMIKPGVTFEALVRTAVERGHFDTEGKDPEEWIQRQIEARKSATNVETLVQFTDGRWMLRRERRTPQGEMIGIRSDVTKFKQQEQALLEAKRKAERAESRLASAIEAISEGFVIYDADDRLVMCNSALREQFSFLTDKLVPGAKFEDLIYYAAANGHFDTQGEDPERWVQHQIAERRASDEAETLVRFADGRWMLRRERRTPQGEMIGIRSDVTKFKQQEAALEEAREKAEAADRAKSEFVANISHELRTPINGIMGFTQLMLMDELSDKQRERAEIVQSSSEHLLQLVNDLLDLSRITSNSIELTPEVFDLPELLRETVRLLKPLAEAKGLDLRADIALPEGATIKADRARMRQILFNVIGNGINYTTEGSVTMSARAEDGGVVFDVADTGPGIAPDKLEAIFDRFVRAENASAQSSGAGLGLTITKGLVELMDGVIDATSSPGNGAIFTVRLPLPVSEPVPGSEPQTGPRNTKLVPAGYDILVAEDHAVNRQLIGEMLNALQCHVTLAETGKQALDAIETGEFDLIIMDNQMPEMTGLEAIGRIRARNDWKRRIPIIALTANAMRGAEKAYQAHGVEAFLTKPFRVDEVVTAIRELGQVGRKLREDAHAKTQ
jgi:PAS domain S-box-containing protein